MHEAKPFQASFTIFAKQKWWGLRNLSANFALKDFYAQIIENFVVAIPDMIESCRITKKVSFHNHLAGNIPYPADVYNCSLGLSFFNIVLFYKKFQIAFGN
ncbi:MAG: hypothetical protein IKB71_00005, partial [Lentisphaeria bacterium]|nr:hypothetical protein [Lentisphaeria bacterium]